MAALALHNSIITCKKTETLHTDLAMSILWHIAPELNRLKGLNPAKFPHPRQFKPWLYLSYLLSCWCLSLWYQCKIVT